MRTRLALACMLAIPVLPSCTNVREKDAAYCRSLGVSDGSQLAQCVANQDLARSQRSLAAIHAGNAMIQASQPRPMTTTTCNRVGNQVVCTSM